MHTLSYPEANEGLWCGENATECTSESEAPLVSAWASLASSYCGTHPNIIGADLF